MRPSDPHHNRPATARAPRTPVEMALVGGSSLAGALIAALVVALVFAAQPAGASIAQDPAADPPSEDPAPVDPATTDPATADPALTDPAVGPEASTDGAAIGGTMTFQDGAPAAAVKVSLFTAKPDRTADLFLRPAFSGTDGRFVFEDLAADCYLIEAEAPVGASFSDGTERHRVHSCVDPGQTDDSAGAVLTVVSEVGTTFELRLLHIGDHHSRLDGSLVELEIEGSPRPVEVGGFARMKTKMTELEEAADAVPTLTVHTGGALSGTPLFSIFGGAADATIMNSVCFDLFALGAQDLELGTSVTQPFLDFLASANCGTEILMPDGNSELTLIRQQTADDPSLEIRRFGEETVGFATIDPPVPAVAAASALDEERLAEVVAAAQQQIDRLTEAGVANVILITELGLENDLALAGRLTEVDAILGGGSHSLLGEFAAVGLTADGSYPARTVNASGEPVCIGHSWHDGKVLGELKLAFDTGSLSDCGGTAHLLAAEGPAPVIADPDVAAAVRTYELALGSLAGQAIGASRERFCLSGVPGRTVGLLCGPDVAGDSTVRTSDVQRLVADAMRSRVDGADVSIINSGAAAGGIPAGTITIERVYRLLPDDSLLAALEMTGAEVAATLEEGIESAIEGGGSPDAYPHATGLRWIADLDEPAGSRATSVEVRPPGVTEWEPIDPEAVYVVATINTLASGAHGYATMAAVSADGRATITATDYAQAFIDFVVQDMLGVVSPFRSDGLD